jgi:hypothetical protein
MDLVPYDHCHPIPPQRPLPLPPLPLPVECRSQYTPVLRLEWEMSDIGKVVRAGVVVRVKGVDSAAGYPFISDDKDQTLPE